MENRKLEGREGQRGSALILVLIALALGSMLITPTLGYVSTGLAEARISEELLLEQYAADAAVEYAMWQLKYNVDGIIDGLNPENPSSSTSITVNGIEVPITTEITQSPVGDSWPFPVPLSESGIHLTTALVIAPHYLSEDGQTTYFPHMVYMFNSGTSTLHMKAAYQKLDKRFTYVPGSYMGPDADITETYVDNHWEVCFDFTNPEPTLAAREATFLTYTASMEGEIGEDTYESEGWVSYAAFGAEEQELYEGEYQAGLVGFYYDITSSIGHYSIIVNVGITDEGEIVVLSWQIL